MSSSLLLQGGDTARYQYGLQHSIEVVSHVSICEPNDAITIRNEARCARRVVFGLIRLSMTVAVEFDAELGVGAIEVGDEAAEEDVLPPDMQAELVSLQSAPQPLFGRSERTTQVTRALQDAGRDSVELMC